MLDGKMLEIASAAESPSGLLVAEKGKKKKKKIVLKLEYLKAFAKEGSTEAGRLDNISASLALVGPALA